MGTLEIILNILISSGAAVAIGGAIVWFSKEYLSANIKERIKSEYDEKLETHKAQLKAQSDVEIEKLKSQLSIAAVERQTRFSLLHEKRANVIADVYAALREAVACLNEYTKPFEPVGGKPRDERRMDAVNAVNAFTKLYSSKQIFIPESAAKKLGQINDELKETFLKFAYTVDLMKDQSLSQTKNWVDAWEKVQKLSTVALRELENDFRQLLGDDMPTTDASGSPSRPQAKQANPD